MSRTAKKILLIEDETNLRRVMRAHLEETGWKVGEASDGISGAQAALESLYDVVLTDLVMPRLDGLGVIARLREGGFSGPVIMITAHATIEAAVAAMKAGAFDFLLKPVAAEDLVAIVRKALRHADAREAEVEPVSEIALESLVGSSPAMKSIIGQIPAIAASDAAVLITGESGTGKTVLARAIHDRSRRRTGPFVVVNSAAVPASLAESEFFGHERGAFTGAIARRPGRFELAAGGTIFLDEIGDLDMPLQAKILRAIEEKKFERVGGSSTIDADLRIIAATHHDLDAARKEGRFRDDLFYRLNVIPIRIPPLRERPEDIPPLVRRFLASASRALGRAEIRIDDAAMEILVQEEWPGNVRELENVIERALVFLQGEMLGIDDLPAEMRRPSPGPAPRVEPLRDGRRTAEAERIREALAQTDGNVTRAAEQLRISRRGLQIKMKEYGLR